MERLRGLCAGLLAALLLLTLWVPTVGAQAADELTADALPKAEVRVAHFSPDAPNVDVYVNGAKALSNVPFGTVSDYLKVKPGRYTFAIRVAGAPASSPPVVSTRQIVLPGLAYTVAAIGQLSSIRLKTYRDAICPPGAGQVKVRVIHAAPDVPAVDIAVTGGPVGVKGLTFPNSSGYITGPAGTYTIELRLAGQTAAVLTLNATLTPGTSYTVAAIGLAGAGSAKLLPLVDRGAAAPEGLRARLCRAGVA